MKITDLEISENNVKSAPDSLKAQGNVTPREIKHIFDKLPELIATKFNAPAEYVEGNIYTKEQADAAYKFKYIPYFHEKTLLLLFIYFYCISKRFPVIY